MNNYAIRAGVAGAGGYVGRELVRMLARHPRVRLAMATSESGAGDPLSSVVPGAPDLPLVPLADAPIGDCDVVFSCLPHGEGGPWVAAASAAGARVIDLSADLRLAAATPAPTTAATAPVGAAAAASAVASEPWDDAGAGTPPAPAPVYGLPELFRADVAGAALIANPGCYPTAVLVALAPLLRRGLVSGPIIVNAASGVTGAGRSPRRELQFAEVAEDYRVYGVGNAHRHHPEMVAHAARLSVVAPELVFTPHLLPVRRGILATIHVPLDAALPGPAALDLWRADYAAEPFVRVLDAGVPSLASAVGTNLVVIGVVAVASASPALQVVAAMDNLLKGAAGQAVQNMNLAFGWPETEGLPC